jgi:hypothetical protein
MPRGSHTSRKVTLLIGAGATVSDFVKKSPIQQPPLDKGFFMKLRNSLRQGKKKKKSQTEGLSEQLVNVSSYMMSTYSIDIFHQSEDSIERVMSRLYTDIDEPELGERATVAFKSLLSLFNHRLAETTNNVKPTNKRNLYQIISGYLKDHVKPEDITIMTFNQDLEIEKTLSHLAGMKTWSRLPGIFCFPHCYELSPMPPVTYPISKINSKLFTVANHPVPRIKVLKLHGSLNWYTMHDTPDPPKEDIFDVGKNFQITQRYLIHPDLKYTVENETKYTFPLVIPPVSHKSSVLHRMIRPLWNKALGALSSSDEVVIFGYSCPANDLEAESLIRRAILNNKLLSCISVIDPSSETLRRYVEISHRKPVHYYPNSECFIEHCKVDKLVH